MISIYVAQGYCKDDISLIENYDKAIADDTQTWDCHHRRETIYSRSGLIEIGEYYNRPACELIFLTHSDHSKLHTKLQDHHIGSSNPMFGKHHSAETRKKISEARKGENNPMFGKHISEETRKKISEANKGKHHSEETRKKMSDALKGTNWYNNGVICVRSKTCPEGFVPGRIVCKKRS